NMTVGAVHSLEVLASHGDMPRLSWASSDPNIAGYHVYRGGIRLNPGLLVEPSFADISYAGASRVTYTVVGVDDGGVESPPRFIEVYPLILEVVANPDEAGQPRPLVAGYFNIFEVTVNNNEASHSFALDRLHLRMTTDEDEQFSLETNIGRNIPGASAHSEAIVAPIGETVAEHELNLKAIQSGDGGSIVIYQRHFTFSDIEWPSGGVEISSNDLPLAGGYTTLHLCIKNHGYANMEIVVSRQNGTQPGEIFALIKNEEGLEISRVEFNGFPPGTYLLSDGTAFVNVPGGESICVDVEILVPGDLEEGTVLTFEGGAGGIYYHLRASDEQESGDLIGEMTSGITQSTYYGTTHVDNAVYLDDDVITITGQAIDRTSGTPLPDTLLKIGFYVRGYKWFSEVATDSEGNYSYEYTPSPGLSGHFTIWAAHPDVYDILRQTEFDLFRIYSSPAIGDIRMSKADSLNFQVELYNPGDVPLTDFSGSFRAYTVDGEGQEVPEDTLSGQFSFGSLFKLEPQERKKVTLQLYAGGDAPDTANVEYTFTATQGASAYFTGAVSLLEAIPILSVDKPAAGYVEVGLDRGSILSKTVTISNKGLKDLQNVELTEPANVPWMTTNLPRDEAGKIFLGDITVGESVTFDVVFTPPGDTAFGNHQDMIVLEGSNSEQAFEINLYAMVTSDLTGSVQFVIKNILGQQLERAAVRMRNVVIQEDTIPVKSDVYGEAMVSGLQEGEWSWQVVAPGHSTEAGVVDIIANQTVQVEVFPSRSLVTIDFRVEPVPYTDRYEIKIEQTFLTHVPVPVMVVDPPYKNYGDVRPGFEDIFMVTVSNAGLVKLEELTMSAPSTDTGKMEPLIRYLPELGAMQNVEIPYRFNFITGDTGENPTPQSYRSPASDRSPLGVGGAAKALCNASGFSDAMDNAGYIGDGVAGMASLHGTLQGRGYCAFSASSALAVAGAVAAVYGAGFQALGVATSLVGGRGIQAAVDLAACLGQQLARLAGGDSKPGKPKPTSAPPGQGFTRGPACFGAGTPIMMMDGSWKPIEAISVGDRIRGLNGGADRVRRVYSREVERVREIWCRAFDGEIKRLVTTDEHLFRVEGKDWILAREIEIGDRFIMVDGKKSHVIRNDRIARPQTVYNFEVDTYHSYFANDVLVYERCWDDREDPFRQAAAEGKRAGAGGQDAARKN
ncbi:polymorphic toxin-type HINT domain-containing protein, partial [Thermodesulfobacteriota bacterium]